MRPVIFVANSKSTTKVYEVEPGVWLKVIKGDDYCQYSWFMGNDWQTSRPGSPRPKTPHSSQYSTTGFKFMWVSPESGDDARILRAHRIGAPAVITGNFIRGYEVIEKDGERVTIPHDIENVVVEWYIYGNRVPSSTERNEDCQVLYCDPFGNEIRKEDIKKYIQEVEISPDALGARIQPFEIRSRVPQVTPSPSLAQEPPHTDTPEYSSDAESSDFTDVNIDMTGVMTFEKLAELVLAKYLLLSMNDPMDKAAQEMLQFHNEVRNVGRAICSSGLVPIYNIEKHNFKTIYNIYVAKLASSVSIDKDYSPIGDAIRNRAIIMKKFKDFGVDDRDSFMNP